MSITIKHNMISFTAWGWNMTIKKQSTLARSTDVNIPTETRDKMVDDICNNDEFKALQEKVLRIKQNRRR